MTEINNIHLRPMSGKIANAALNGGWARDVPWPADELGAYGANTSTDADVDAWVARETGVAPGSVLSLDDAGLCFGVLSACPGRDLHLRPVIRLSIRQAGVIQ